MKDFFVCVGSLNPTKFQAVKNAFEKYFEKFQIFSMKAESKVPNQPIGLTQIIEGAINRAKSALAYLITEKERKTNIFGVGIEAGLIEVPQAKTQFIDLQFCVIVNEKNETSLGSGVGFEYPKTVIDQVLSDRTQEVGEIIGKLEDNLNLKNETGAISYLSKGVINRTEILTQAVICALIPIVNKELYR